MSQIDIGDVLTLGGVGIVGYYLYKFMKSEEKFEEEPTPLVDTGLIIQEPAIAPIVMPSPPVANGEVAVSGINWLSGRCPTLQMNIQKDIAFAASDTLLWFIPRWKSATEYKDCAQRIHTYWERATEGVHPCDASWSDTQTYVSWLIANYTLDARTALSEYTEKEQEKITKFRDTAALVLTEMQSMGMSAPTPTPTVTPTPTPTRLTSAAAQARTIAAIQRGEKHKITAAKRTARIKEKQALMKAKTYKPTTYRERTATLRERLAREG